MNNILRESSSAPQDRDRLELRRLLPVTRDRSGSASTFRREAVGTIGRVFDLDAQFESGGAWAGVDRLAEAAYLSLLEMKEDAIIEKHLYELHRVLLAHRDRIQPKSLCLTDTATAEERTRFYPLERAYRIVNGLVGLVLQWKKAMRDNSRWIVVVRNFDQAQHLATRFFVELARRCDAEREIDVIVEIRDGRSGFATPILGMEAVPIETGGTVPPTGPRTSSDGDEVQSNVPDSLRPDEDDVLFERNYPRLLADYRRTGDMLAAAQTALRILTIYVSDGYYHEAKSFLAVILPHFEEIASRDEARRMHYVSKFNICQAMIGDPAAALGAVEKLAEGRLTAPGLLADMNYILGIHYLRYAETKDIERAERHLLRAVELTRSLVEDEVRRDPFRKVFIDNGLAFLRARQGRHQEAMDLCKAGYDFLTRELGEERHKLHRSVLLYNIAQVYVAVDELAEGLLYYNKAIQMDPNYSEYHNEAGNLLQEMGRYDEALDYYARAIECSAPYPEVYFNKAACHLHVGSLDEALSCFTISLELNPNQPEGHALQADVLRELGRGDEALQGYDAATALGYKSTAVWVNRAVLHFNNGSYDRALADMDAVIARDGDNADHYENRAAIYKAMAYEDLCRRDLTAAQRCREAA